MQPAREILPLEYANAIVSAVASGRGGRGVSSLCGPEIFQNAASALSGLKRVAVVSGFYIPACGAAETDGPSGAVVLARAFHRHGVESEIWTDERCAGIIRPCAESVGYPPELVKTPDPLAAVSDFKPDGVVFVERPGRASNGRYYNFRMEDISDYVSPLDLIAGECADKGIVTCGIGDGGNEAGMGAYYAELCALLPQYRKCISTVRADFAVAADVSNWGSYGLTAALSYMWGKNYGHIGGDERRMLEAVMKAGGVDGILLKPALSVDGFPLDVQKSVIMSLNELCKRFAM